MEAGRSALRLAVAALATDAVIALLAWVVATQAFGPSLRQRVPFLAGYCLTWSLWAPLLLGGVSVLAVVLAYRARWYEAPRRSATRKLVGAARFLAIASTVAWAATTLVVAYANVSTCIID